MGQRDEFVSRFPPRVQIALVRESKLLTNRERLVWRHVVQPREVCDRQALSLRSDAGERFAVLHIYLVICVRASAAARQGL
jgi:hypothetical protein